MRKIVLAFSLVCGICLPVKGGDSFSRIILYPQKTTEQVIDGFGVAQAGWADELYLFKNREQVIDAMFGPDGLRLNILRGEIFPHYSTEAGKYQFDVKADVGQAVVDNAPTLDKKDLLRRGQLWLSTYTQKKYPDTHLIYAAWSPPAWMKENGYETPDHYASHGRLKPIHYQDFADYLAAFYKAYQSAGANAYAISPSNEPGYPAPWNSCVWSADEMGEFVSNYLLPTFEKQQIPSKIIFGENPAWSTVFEMLKMISSADFTNSILQKYPGMDMNRLIAAGHGYVLPDTVPLPKEYLATPIIPFTEAEKHKVPVWVTEISDITPLDLSIEDGLYWSETFHKYLTDAHVNAIVWWAGAQPSSVNECLIVLDKATGNFTFSKRYETFGNYTRYIPVGSRRIENESVELPEGVSVTSFRKDNQYTVVVTNPTDKQIDCDLQLEGFSSKGNLSSYTTSADKRWEEGSVKSGKRGYTLQLLPKSVTTYVGSIR